MPDLHAEPPQTSSETPTQRNPHAPYPDNHSRPRSCRLHRAALPANPTRTAAAGAMVQIGADRHCRAGRADQPVGGGEAFRRHTLCADRCARRARVAADRYPARLEKRRFYHAQRPLAPPVCRAFAADCRRPRRNAVSRCAADAA